MATLNTALAELNQALELLEAALERRAQDDLRIQNLEQQIAALQDDRSNLSQQLEASRAAQSDTAPQQGQLELIERKIDGAINNIETVLAAKSNAA